MQNGVHRACQSDQPGVLRQALQTGLTYGQEADWASLRGESPDAKEASSPCRKTAGPTGEARPEQERVGGGTKKWESGGMGFRSEHTGMPFLRAGGRGEFSITQVFRQR